MQFAGELADSFNPERVFLVRAVREIQAGNIDASKDQFSQRVDILATGADRRDNFCISGHTHSLLRAEFGG